MCSPSTDNAGEQDVECSGDATETDTTSCQGRTTSVCPDEHCPAGFHFSSKYEYMEGRKNPI